MEWFKHSTASHDDPDLSDAMDEFGHAGYSVFFIILEIYGNEYNHADSDGWVTLSKKYLERKLQMPWLKRGKTMEQCWSERGVDRGKSRSYLGVILEFFRSRQRFELRETPETASIRIPKFIAISSNWTKRKNASPTEALQSTSVVPTAKEEEEEEEKKKTLVPDAVSDPCPHQEILSLYKKNLSMLTQHTEWGEDRQKLLRAIWRSSKEYQDLEWWEQFFQYIARDCPFLIGDNNRGWQADLPWILQKKHFTDIREGKYYRGKQ